MSKKQIFCLIISLMMFAGCGKKSRLTADTFNLKVEPGSTWVLPGGNVELTVSGNTPSRSDVNIGANWILQTSGKGSLSSDYGNKTVFTAASSAYGTATIAVVYKQFIKTVDIGIGVKDILNDFHAAGYVGVFPGGISASKFLIADTTAYFMEGEKSVVATFNLSPGEWGGYYIQSGEDSLAPTKTDMSAYSSGNVRFWVKTPVDLEIKIDTIVKRLSLLGFYTDDAWHEVSIAINTLGLTDITRVEKFFTITAKSDGSYNGNAPISGSFYVDDVRWTIN
jgi:hypothetical protein